jgi:redox-sensing transcriptional repressor
LEQIPSPAIQRLCLIYQQLVDLERRGIAKVSSAELGEHLGIGAHNVRKDINYLGNIGNSGAGYDVFRLKETISQSFEFNKEKRACIAGLGRIGSAILHYPQIAGGEFKIVAGFDSNINKLETIKTDIAVFPAHQIVETVKRLNIDFAVLAVPIASAQDVADRLVDGGIKGIINFVPTVIKSRRQDVIIRNIDIAGELRVLSALIHVNNLSNNNTIEKE